MSIPPNDKRQAARPPKEPRLFRDHLLHRLPKYTGKYPVGSMEIEVPARQPRVFSNIKRHNEFVLRMDTILFSVYYPADLPCVDHLAQLRLPWLPRPRLPTCKGYAKFFNVPNFPIAAYLASTSMFTKLPAFRNVPLAQKRTETKGDELADSCQEEEQHVAFPVVIFSHGLGGSRTACSSICGELASSGIVVVAVEHRDGSSARTYVNLPNRASQPGENNKGCPANLTRSTSQVRKSEGHYIVDYLLPEGNARDTAPNNDRGVDMTLRAAQIDMRLAEIEEVIHNLRLINSGHGAAVAQVNLRRKGNIGSSSRGLCGIDWAAWTGQLDLDCITMMGHSFGGATTVQVLRRHSRFPCIAQGILLDAWGVAIPWRQQDVTEKFKPLLSIGSEAFMFWEENFDSIERVCMEARAGGMPVWMLTVRGSAHLSQTDFAVLYPRLMSLVMKTTINFRRGIYLTVGLCLEFLRLVMPARERDLESKWLTSMLAVTTHSRDDIPSEHKPDKKWVAERLRIPHEGWLRLQAWFRRRAQRDKKKRKMMDLEDGIEGDEVWTHVAPKPWVLEQWLLEK